MMTHPAIYLAIAWFIGIWLAATVDFTVAVWLTVAAGLLGITAVFWRIQRTIALPALWLLLLCLGGARYRWAQPVLDESHISFYNESQLTIRGLITDEPDQRDRFTNVRLAAATVILPDGSEQPVQGDILLRVFPYPEVAYGMEVQINGRLQTPPDDIGSFDYRSYLARQDIYSLIDFPTLTILATDKGTPWRHLIFDFKRRATAAIKRLIAAPQAALLTGILLGNDAGIPPGLEEDFRTTGMTHIIAISGFNIALLIAVITAVGNLFLTPRQSALVAIVGVAVYTVLVGADPSVVRAAVMGTLYLIARRWAGRPSFALSSLLLTALLMSLFRPTILWDVGFQLSFAATLGLMLYVPPLQQRLQRVLARYLTGSRLHKVGDLITELLLVTVAAQILTLPLMVGYFQQLSLVSLLANLLILPAQPGVMFWGGLATLVGMVLPLLAQPFAWAAWLFLRYTIWLVEALAALPGAAVSLTISTEVVVAVELLLLTGTWLLSQPTDRLGSIWETVRQNLSQRLALALSTIAMLLVVNWGLTQPDGLLHVTFFDVGQGDATFVQTPTGRQLLVDGGLYPTVLMAHLGDAMPFWDRHIDLLVATHPDADHIAGLTAVFDRYQVDRLLVNGAEAAVTAQYEQLLQVAARQGTEIHRATAGETILIEDGVRIDILHPGLRLDPQNRNENSVALRLEYDAFSLLLTGDGEIGAERALLANGRSLQSVVYQAGHHGSASSSGAPLLAAVQPQIMVISAGADNQFGHPHAEVLQRAAAVGAAILRTDQLGSLALTTDGAAMWWQARP